MSNNNNKNNYNRMYTKPVNEAVPAEVKEAEAAKSEPVTPAKPMIGTVKCELLNVRVAPNKEATIAAVIVKDAKVTINKKESTDGWYKVVTENNITGYCMKKFIAV